MSTHTELKQELKSQIEFAPAAGNLVTGLKGFWVPVVDGDSFVCSHCANRIMGRGFSLPSATPSYQDDPYGVCIVCEV